MPAFENVPSPNHSTLRMPAGEDLLFQGITKPGHQENPCTFPHTSSPVRKPLPSCRRRCDLNGVFFQPCGDSFPVILPDRCVSGAFLVRILRPAPEEEVQYVMISTPTERTPGHLPSLRETLRPFCCPVARRASASCCCQPETPFGPPASGANCPPSRNVPDWPPEIQKRHRLTDAATRGFSSVCWQEGKHLPLSK